MIKQVRYQDDWSDNSRWFQDDKSINQNNTTNIQISNKILYNFDITNLSNFHTPAKAKYFYNFQWNIAELKEVLKKFKHTKKLFVSGGTNLLFAFDIFDWLVIKLSNYDLDTNFNIIQHPSRFDETISGKFKLENNILQVSGFEKISHIAEILYDKNLSNTWMRFIGLPWTIAWAVVGNAGCFGLEIQHTFLKAEVLDLDSLTTKIITKDQANFSYRNSIFKNGKYIVLQAWFDLSSPEEKYSFNWTIQDIVNFRKNKQPRGYSCWSFFKNPSKEYPAWKLIESVWLKGYKLGWAYFSDQHANFLMSDGTATYKDLINLKNLAQQKVKEKFGIQLVPEVNIVEG